jgi:hypothetical protein
MPGTAAIPCPDRIAGIKELKFDGSKPKGITAEAETELESAEYLKES